MDRSQPQQSGSGRRRGRSEGRAETKAGPRQPVAFVDSSAIVALADRQDATHAPAVAAYHSLVDDGYRLFTTNHVIVESFALLSVGLGPELARQWLRDCRLPVYTADAADEERARRMVLDNPSDRPLTLTDAISLVVMERLGIADAFAIDPDFMAALS
jgi:predicted nucleic acid-binding protein